MRFGLFAAALLASIMLPADAGGAGSSLARPLHLPHPTRGCPVTKTVDRDRMVVSVSGPVWLQNVGAAPKPGRIDISRSSPDSQGWRGEKTPWLVPASYRGPVLVRGERLDRAGPVSFAKSYGQHLRELRFASGETNGNGGEPRRRFLASESLFRGTGCYGFQVDGTSFSAVIVMRVIG